VELPVPLTINPYDLASGLKDAIEVMSQYLTGNRQGDWFVPGTCKYFDEIGATVPSKPISEADLIALSAIVERCDLMRSDPTKATTRGLPKFDKAVAQIAPYLKAELGIELDAKAPINDVLNSTVADLATATAAVKSEYLLLRSVPYAIPGAGYVRPPAPNEAYLEQDRDLKPEGNRELEDIAGTRIDASSEFWQPPEPTSVVDHDYGPAPRELFP
jgi:hypothetical protein